jgi:hypothetical protein
LIFDGLVQEKHVRGMLNAEGLAEAEIADAMVRLSAANTNDIVRLSDSIMAVNRKIVDDTVFPARSRATAADDHRAFMLIAYNWLCLLLGSAVLVPAFEAVREFIRSGRQPEAVAVDRVFSTSRLYDASHALAADTHEHVTVTIWLFRMLGYIVRFRGIIGCSLPGAVGIQELAPPQFVVVPAI